MKGAKPKKFDAAERRRTPAARAEYLNIVLADGDPLRSAALSILSPARRA
jgi:DNA-binding phage protein